MRDPKRRAFGAVPALVACVALVYALAVAEERLAEPQPAADSTAPRLNAPAIISYPRGDWGTRRVGM